MQMSDKRDSSPSKPLADARPDTVLPERDHPATAKQDIADIAETVAYRADPEAVRDLMDAELADVAAGYSMLQHGSSMGQGARARPGALDAESTPGAAKPGSVRRLLGF